MSPATVTETPTHRYRLRSLEASSAKYGPCEVCGGPCADVSMQAVFTKVRIEGRTTYAAGPVTFGHELCLLDQRGVA